MLRVLIPSAFLLLSLQAQAMNWQSAETQMYQTNKELQSLEAKVKAQEYKAKSALSNFLPDINAKGGYQDERTVEDNYQGYVGYLQGQWNLFRGGADWALHKNEKLESKILEIELDRKKKTLRRQLAEVYYGLWIQDESLKLWKEKQDLLVQQRGMAKRKIEAGLSSNVDGLEIDLEENMAEAEVEAFKHAKERLQADLLKLIPDAPSNIAVATTDLPTPPVFSKESAESLTSKSSLVAQSQIVAEQAQKLKTETASGFIPQLVLETSYGRITPEYSNPLAGNESRVALLASWNLFSGGRNFNDYRAAREAVISKSRDSEQESRRVYAEITSVQSRYLEKDHLRGLLKKREKFAKSYYDMTLSEYRRGIKNSADLASATRGLYDTRQKLILIESEINILAFHLDELI